MPPELREAPTEAPAGPPTGPPSPPILPPALASASPATWRAVRGVLTDIDDTLTRHGRLDPAAASALAALAAARVPVVAVTGRSLAWVREAAEGWPVARAFTALVAENGAVAIWPHGRGWACGYAQPHAARRANARRLAACAAAVQRAVPGARPARDNPGRETDIAIDHAEHAALPADAVARVVATMHAHGLVATVSSIHVNGWIGAHDKFSGAAWMLRHRLGLDLADAAEAARWVFVGDSANDEVMFRRLPLTVGVANLRRFAAVLRHWPAYLAAGERGAGFAELVQAVLATRGAGVGGESRRGAEPTAPAS